MAIHDIYSGRDEALTYRRLPPPPVASAPTHQPGLASLLWRRGLIVLASLVVCCAAGLAYIAITPSRYLATAAMLIDPRLGKSIGNDPNTPGFIADAAAMDSQIKLFTSQIGRAHV